MSITADDVYALAPFSKTLGVEFGTLGTELVEATLPYRESLSTVGGGLHGGALMGLADVCAAVSAVLNAPPGSSPATADSTTHFLRPVRGDAHATATPLSVGRSMVVVVVTITDGDGAVCAQVTQGVVVRREK